MALNDVAILHDLSAVFARLRVPTLVVSRRDDPLLAPEESRRIAMQVSDAELVILDGSAHLTHDGDVDALVEVVRRFLRGGRRPGTDERARSMAAGLTAREQEILELVAAGLSNKAIGERLVVSVRTVERHTLNIYAKLGVRSRAEAVAAGLHRSEQLGSA